MRNFVIVNNRQRLHEAVFGPDHALPTMSIDEYLSREAQRGNVLSGGANSQTGQVGDRDAKPDPEELGEEAEEAALHKQREFDDWKDDHRRGEGNRMRHG
jgi:immunoglobulin-binding protein 1